MYYLYYDSPAIRSYLPELDVYNLTFSECVLHVHPARHCSIPFIVQWTKTLQIHDCNFSCLITHARLPVYLTTYRLSSMHSCKLKPSVDDIR